MEQLEKLLVDVKQRLAEHDNGISLLESEEKKKLERKLKAFQKHYDTMKSTPPEDDIQRFVERERMLQQRHEERRRRSRN